MLLNGGDTPVGRFELTVGGRQQPRTEGGTNFPLKEIGSYSTSSFANLPILFSCAQLLRAHGRPVATSLSLSQPTHLIPFRSREMITTSSAFMGIVFSPFAGHYEPTGTDSMVISHGPTLGHIH